MQSRHLVAACRAAATSLGPSAHAALPGGPFAIVGPATPAGAIDVTACLIGAKLAVSQGQPVSMDNVGGTAGILSTDRVAKAAQGGHTSAEVGTKGYETSGVGVACWCGMELRKTWARGSKPAPPDPLH